jgi:hypothetical protein
MTGRAALKSEQSGGLDPPFIIGERRIAPRHCAVRPIVLPYQEAPAAVTTAWGAHESARIRPRQALSAASAGGGVIQPIPGLIVCPTRDGEARGGRHALAGTNDDMLARA